VSFDQIRTACVIRFPYLWAREAQRGETEGRKVRPVAVAVRISRPKGEEVLVLFPITSQPRFSKAFFLPLVKEFIARRAARAA
jgi:hypothetical protein